MTALRPLFRSLRHVKDGHATKIRQRAGIHKLTDRSSYGIETLFSETSNRNPVTGSGLQFSDRVGDSISGFLANARPQKPGLYFEVKKVL